MNLLSSFHDCHKITDLIATILEILFNDVELELENFDTTISGIKEKLVKYI